MIVSILTRKARTQDRAQWQALIRDVVPQIEERLNAEPGFLRVEYLWSVYEDGAFAQITTWQTLDDCHRYVRDGGAATVATLEEAAIPTAPHPNGAWVRRTYETAVGHPASE